MPDRLRLTRFGCIYQHLVVDIQGSLPIAQFFFRFAVPHVSQQADSLHAVALEDVVEGLGRRLQCLFAILAKRIGISLGKVIIDQRILKAAVQ